MLACCSPCTPSCVSNCQSAILHQLTAIETIIHSPTCDTLPLESMYTLIIALTVTHDGLSHSRLTP